MNNRTLALEFYRINLHGTGWKVESGDFCSAIEMLSSYLKTATKLRDFALGGQLKDLLTKVKAAQKAAYKKAA